MDGGTRPLRRRARSSMWLRSIMGMAPGVCMQLVAPAVPAPSVECAAWCRKSLTRPPRRRRCGQPRAGGVFAGPRARAMLVASAAGDAIDENGGGDHQAVQARPRARGAGRRRRRGHRSEEHTTELQVTNAQLACRLLIEKLNET